MPVRAATWEVIRIQVVSSISPKNTGARSKNILFNENDKPECTNHDNFRFNKIKIFQYTFFFDPVSSSSKHLLKVLNIVFFPRPPHGVMLMAETNRILYIIFYFRYDRLM